MESGSESAGPEGPHDLIASYTQGYTPSNEATRTPDLRRQTLTLESGNKEISREGERLEPIRTNGAHVKLMLRPECQSVAQMRKA